MTDEEKADQETFKRVSEELISASEQLVKDLSDEMEDNPHLTIAMSFLERGDLDLALGWHLEHNVDFRRLPPIPGGYNASVRHDLLAPCKEAINAFLDDDEQRQITNDATAQDIFEACQLRPFVIFLTVKLTVKQMESTVKRMERRRRSWFGRVFDKVRGGR